jgi:heat shock protein HtpX
MHSMTGYLKTAALLGLLTALIVVAGGALGGEQGIVLAFGFAVLMNAGAWWFSDKIVLALYRARPVSEAEAPELHAVVQGLASRAGIPMPRLYLLPQEAPNAFATGRGPRHAAVAVTRGLLALMDREELEGVLAHELSHVRNRDILISSVAATLAGAVMILARIAGFAALFGGGRGNEREGGGLGMLFTIILAPIAAMLIQLWVSRTREYAADDSGAALTGNPRGLASALRKLEAYARRAPMPEATPATAHLFIVSPLSARQAMASLFSTHPPIEARVRRLLGER